MEIFKLNIPNKKEYVISARLAASSVAGIHGFDIEKVEDIRLAVGEACNNVVLHGRGSKSIDIIIEIGKDFMKISVSDQGGGFVLEKINPPTPEDYMGSGLGLYIIDSLMDEMIVESEEEKGTTIHMIKKR
ncbi:MAG TPA: ATP-binding protein [Clostridia bacterium]|nr:ATP-binding protein [Clostridia bacterium]